MADLSTCKKGAPAEPRQSTAAASVSVRLEKHGAAFLLCFAAVVRAAERARRGNEYSVGASGSQSAAPARGDLFEDVFGYLPRVAPPPTSLSLCSATSPICRSLLRFFVRRWWRRRLRESCVSHAVLSPHVIRASVKTTPCLLNQRTYLYSVSSCDAKSQLQSRFIYCGCGSADLFFLGFFLVFLLPCCW